ncbi:EAL domain-containing protein [Paucibacter sp. APW11]|uniref:EAL domain-containing protein n=1 Tax=Roseateles aquae TaxID=3077235 RepID=A0ABU3PI42_9BURK|nr:EAL domain-containing protein [Paucibacter sp. APW11]MDT9002224.1 EAL domain-containing protein [Paucibacter sp. APW11]
MNPPSAPPPAPESWLRHLLDELPLQYLLVLDGNGALQLCSRPLRQLLRLGPQSLPLDAPTVLAALPEVLCQHLQEELLNPAPAKPEISWQIDLQHPVPDGQHTLAWQVRRIRSAGPAQGLLLASAIDISDRQAAHAREALQSQVLHHLVYEDELTGLTSRYAARERMLSLIERQEDFGLLAVKLRDFSLLRDNFGPEGADEVLRAAARALESVVEAPLLLARSTGVEFTIVVPGEPDVAALQRLGRSVLNRFAQPLKLSQAELVISVSVGIACFPLHGGTLEELMRNVGTALHAAQEEGGRIQRVFDPKMQQKARERLWLDHHLRKALELQQLELHYQPKLSLLGEPGLAVEALLRWRHPKRGLIRPDLFIARAEDNGQISAMGRWVIVSAAAQAAQWHRMGLEVRIAVNISARQLSDPDLLRWLSECQRIAHGLLDVELTESSVIDDEAGTHAFMQECRNLGFKVYLDDFGTGFSSLAQLARLPIDVIKLDRSFLRPGSEQQRSEALMRSVVSVARELKLRVIAEGVEKPQQEQFLRNIGVDGAQGWLYAAAMPADDYVGWLRGKGLAPAA